MKYMILVSHGNFAHGLKDSLEMLAGKRPEVISAGLPNNGDAASFAESFARQIADIPSDAPIVMFADLIGGSPLTTAMNVLQEEGRLANTQIFGGMNLPLVLTGVLMKDAMDGEMLAQSILGEAHTGLREFTLESEEEDDV